MCWLRQRLVARSRLAVVVRVEASGRWKYFNYFLFADKIFDPSSELISGADITEIVVEVGGGGGGGG